jgi:hypothetical protein
VEHSSAASILVHRVEHHSQHQSDQALGQNRDLDNTPGNFDMAFCSAYLPRPKGQTFDAHGLISEYQNVEVAAIGASFAQIPRLALHSSDATIPRGTVRSRRQQGDLSLHLENTVCVDELRDCQSLVASESPIQAIPP